MVTGADISRRPVWAPWGPPLAVLLCGALPLFVIMQTSDQPRGLTFVLQVAVAMYAGLRLTMIVQGSRLRLLQGMFWVFCYVAMGIAPIAQLTLGKAPTRVVDPTDAVRTAVLLTLLGMLAYDVGTALSRRAPHFGATDRSTGEASPDADSARANPSLRRVALLGLLSVVGSAVLIAKVGPASFFSSRQAVNAGLAAAGLTDDSSQVGSALLRGVGTVPVLIVFLVLTRRLVSDPASRRRPAVVALWVLTLAVQVMVNNPISNPRFWFLTVALSTLFVALRGRMWVVRAVMVGGIAAALVVFPVSDKFRYEPAQARQLQSSSVFETVATKDYDQMAMFANAVSYAEDGPGHTLGRQTTGALLFWVPRTAWDNKPVDTGTLVGEWVGATNVNLSAPIWMELWLDAGLPGMLVVLLLLGFGSARLDDWYDRVIRHRSPAATVGIVAVPLLAGYEFILLRGSLLQAMGRLSVGALCLVILAVHSTRSERSAEADASGMAALPDAGPQEVGRVPAALR